MSLSRKFSMLRSALRIGRDLGDQTRLLSAFAKHGGLFRFGGNNEVNVIDTKFAGAPTLHWRDVPADVILLVEVLVEEDYGCLRSLNLKPGRIFDIGANIGLGSCFLRQLYPDARITAFEPSESEARLLRLNLSAWGRAEHQPTAVGNRDGTVSFAIDPQRTGGQHVAETSDDSRWQHVTVPLARIETLIDRGELETPDLVKMDIEGAEVEALAGFGRHLGTPQAYVLETHTPQLHDQCRRMLGAAGYSVTFDQPRNDTARILCMAR